MPPSIRSLAGCTGRAVYPHKEHRSSSTPMKRKKADGVWLLLCDVVSIASSARPCAFSLASSPPTPPGRHPHRVGAANEGLSISHNLLKRYPWGRDRSVPAVMRPAIEESP